MPEKRILHFLIRHKTPIFAGLMILLAGLVRFSALDYLSADADMFLLPWFEQIRLGGGFAALGEQVGDYNIPYQVLIVFLTYLPGKPLHLFKLLSYFFDFLLALACGGLCCALNGRRSPALFAAVMCTVLLLPTVIFNSAVFAQCDSIYASFCVLALWALYRGKYPGAFLLWGAALAFKLQAVFLLPFFLLHYFTVRRYTVFLFFLPPGMLYLLSLPAFFCGRGLAEPLSLYLSQTDSYRSMWLYFPSFWSLIGDSYEALKPIAVGLTVAALGFGLYWLLHRKISCAPKKNFLRIAAWSVWTCLLFLPAMHERYGYLLDILLVALAFAERRHWIFPAVTLCCSGICYGQFLFGNSSIPIQAVAVVYLAAYLGFTYALLLRPGKAGLTRNALNLSEQEAES